MLTVLVPIPTSDYCFLSEAVLYAALGRLPLDFHAVDGWDEREDPDYQERIAFDWKGSIYEPGGTLVSQKTYEELGIGPHPAYDPNADPEWPERIGEWSAKLDHLLDNYRLRILNLLHDGQLGARGRKLPDTVSVDDAAKGFHDTPWDTIPSNYWATARLDWGLHCAQGRGATYRSIKIVTSDLFREFPLPAPQQASEVVQVGDNFILLDDTTIRARRHERSAPSGLLGRPPLINWTEFHVEVAARLRDGLPSKQESFISEMQEWCKKRWGREVGRSTVLEKISPYYDRFVRSKKPKNNS